uniref:Secreted protein n=1 Tax=Trichuris muris TaxID=70415 RepID=A0A5S6QPI8_TRIMR
MICNSFILTVFLWLEVVIALVDYPTLRSRNLGGSSTGSDLSAARCISLQCEPSLLESSEGTAEGTTE